MRRNGKIEYWNHQKAYGFIQPLGGGKQIFVHISAFQTKGVIPREGLKVSFELATDKLGRLNASKVLLSGEKSKRKADPKSVFSKTLFVGLIYFIALALSVEFTRLPMVVLLWQIGISTLCYLVYASDKKAARANRWRVSEITMHVLSVLGGWPGALYAQQRLRHKSRKKSFRIIFWVTVVLSVAWTLYLHTTEGRWYLTQFLQLVT